MPVWSIDSIEDRPDVTLRDWAVFEVPLDGPDQPWTRHLAGWSCEDQQGQVCSAVRQFDPQMGSCLTESGRPGLNADAEYVWNRWKRIAGLTEQREVTKEVADALRTAKKGAGDGLAT
jgi:hypothetical protein